MYPKPYTNTKQNQWGKPTRPGLLPIGCYDGKNECIVCQCGCIEALKGLLLCSICIWWFARELTWCHSLKYPNNYPNIYTYWWGHHVTRWDNLTLLHISLGIYSFWQQIHPGKGSILMYYPRLDFVDSFLSEFHQLLRFLQAFSLFG